MRTSLLLLALSFVLLLALAACGRESDSTSTPRAGEPGPEPEVVTVDHILIGVKSPRMPKGKSVAEARKIAHDLLERLRAGTGDWDTFKHRFSDDPPPGGPYTMTNLGVPAQGGAYPRKRMAKAFGDVGFSLKVGEIGLAEYEPKTCPFGFHIIKRIR